MADTDTRPTVTPGGRRLNRRLSEALRILLPGGAHWLAGRLVKPPNGGVAGEPPPPLPCSPDFPAPDCLVLSPENSEGSLFARIWPAGAIRMGFPGSLDAGTGRWTLTPGTVEKGPLFDSPRGTVVLLHGLHRDGWNLLSWAASLNRNGYTVILPDLPGHGASSLPGPDWGPREWTALSLLLDGIEENGAPRPFLVLGFSYGGAIAIGWAAREKRIQATISLAPFPETTVSLRSFLGPALGPVLAPLLRWRLHATLAAAEAILGHPMVGEGAESWSRNLRTPLLLLHGAKDAHLPPEGSHRIAAAAQGPVSLRLLPDEDHASLPMRGEMGWAEIKKWLENLGQ